MVLGEVVCELMFGVVFWGFVCFVYVVFGFFRSLGLAKVSFKGARKPSVFHTPESLLVSFPWALICRKMAVGMEAIMMCVCFVW